MTSTSTSPTITVTRKASGECWPVVTPSYPAPVACGNHEAECLISEYWETQDGHCAWVVPAGAIVRQIRSGDGYSCRQVEVTTTQEAWDAAQSRLREWLAKRTAGRAAEAAERAAERDAFYARRSASVALVLASLSAGMIRALKDVEPSKRGEAVRSLGHGETLAKAWEDMPWRVADDVPAWLCAKGHRFEHGATAMLHAKRRNRGTVRV